MSYTYFFRSLLDARQHRDKCISILSAKVSPAILEELSQAPSWRYTRFERLRESLDQEDHEQVDWVYHLNMLASAIEYIYEKEHNLSVASAV